MKSNIKNTKKSSSKATSRKSFAVGTNPGQIFASVPYTSEDFKNSLLIVSVALNVFVLTAWITLQVSEEYALVVAQALVQ